MYKASVGVMVSRTNTFVPTAYTAQRYPASVIMMWTVCAPFQPSPYSHPFNGTVQTKPRAGETLNRAELETRDQTGPVPLQLRD